MPATTHSIYATATDSLKLQVGEGRARPRLSLRPANPASFRLHLLSHQGPLASKDRTGAIHSIMEKSQGTPYRLAEAASLDERLQGLLTRLVPAPHALNKESPLAPSVSPVPSTGPQEEVEEGR